MYEGKIKLPLDVYAIRKYYLPGSKIKFYRKKLLSQKNTLYHVQPRKLPVITVIYGKVAVIANL